MIKGKPLFERLIVRDIPVPSKTLGGLLLPEHTKDAPNKGEIIKIGHTALLDKDGVNQPELLLEGDIVLYTKFAGIPFNYKGEQYKIIMINEIIFIYDKVDGIEILEEAYPPTPATN